MIVTGADWQRLSLLIKQTEDRLSYWEQEQVRCDRRWRRGQRDIDRRHLTSDRAIEDAEWELMERHRLWVPEEQAKADRALLDHLYSLRSQMLTASDGSECQ